MKQPNPNWVKLDKDVFTLLKAADKKSWKRSAKARLCYARLFTQYYSGHIPSQYAKISGPASAMLAKT